MTIVNYHCFIVYHNYCAVGKIRKQWMEQSLSGLGVDMIRALKQQIDPTNVFGCGNLLP